MYSRKVEYIAINRYPPPAEIRESQQVRSDEKWVIYEDIVRKRQRLDKDEPPLPDPKTNIHGKKILLYVQQLQRVRPALVNRKNVILLHDNTRPHTAKVTQEKIIELGWSVLPHPSYFLDLSPTDYHLFCSLQKFLKGKPFSSEEQITQAVENFSQSKPATFYKEGTYKLPGRWEKIIDNGGEYVIN
ncbi:histone-lysine N-methyltransferase SETMAR [Trichonephila clavipes]|nr:histone-lysine N-methyltransferase SETMAR [Trichonephila clavipes]